MSDHKTTRATSAVNPSHYRLPGRKECIDEIRERLGDPGFIAFCRGNAMKYRYRAGLKEGEAAAHDFAKAGWYSQMSEHVRVPHHVQDPRIAPALGLLDCVTPDPRTQT